MDPVCITGSIRRDKVKGLRHNSFIFFRLSGSVEGEEWLHFNRCVCSCAYGLLKGRHENEKRHCRSCGKWIMKFPKLRALKCLDLVDLSNGLFMFKVKQYVLG